MGKEKPTAQSKNKKALQKSSAPVRKKTPLKSKEVRKLQSRIRKEVQDFDEMGSLMFLKDITVNKQLRGIDERIRLLKTELKSLLECTKSDNNNDFPTDNSSGFILEQIRNVNKSSKIPPRVVEPNFLNLSEQCEKSCVSKTEDFKPSSSSTPFKFSVWLGNTVNEMSSQIGKEKLTDPNKGPNLTIQLDSSETPLQFSSNFKSSFSNKYSLPQDQVEKLLYKSFVLQNSEVHSCADNGSDHIRLFSNLKYKKCKSRFQEEKQGQGKLKKYCKFYQNGRKRRLTNRNPSSEVEVIDLGKSLLNTEKAEVNYVYLDLDDYNWSEPFNSDEYPTCHPDLEIIDKDNKSYTKLNNLYQKIKTSELFENNQSKDYIKDGTLQEKEVWECPVCFEQSKGQEVVATRCGHVFCKKCIEIHFSKLTKNCPTCRSELKEKPFVTLFNF